MVLLVPVLQQVEVYPIWASLLGRAAAVPEPIFSGESGLGVVSPPPSLAPSPWCGTSTLGSRDSENRCPEAGSEVKT